MNAVIALRPTCWPATRSYRILSSFRRYSSSNASSAAPPTESEAKYAKTDTKMRRRRRPLTSEQEKFLDGALRVNQAGELAATLIYTHQTPPLLRTHPHLRPLITHMYDQEAGHFDHFNKMLAKHRIRPTAMYPVWVAASSLLGWSTGLMGREAAMACTEAVETEIGGHYNEQVRVLLEWVKDIENRGEEVGEEFDDLIQDLKRIRDEELEHLDDAVGEGAKEARPYVLLNKVIRGGCRGAIWISERV